MCMRVYSLLYTDMSEHEYIDYLHSKSIHLAAFFPTLYVNQAVYVNTSGCSLSSSAPYITYTAQPVLPYPHSHRYQPPVHVNTHLLARMSLTYTYSHRASSKQQAAETDIQTRTKQRAVGGGQTCMLSTQTKTAQQS